MTLATTGIGLYWIPLGAGVGGGLVRWSGRAYEAIAAARTHRRRHELFHSALEVMVDDSTTVIEMAPVWVKSGDRGVVAEGPVGTRSLGRLHLFRYEVRCWTGGCIPDAAAAGQRIEVSQSAREARAVLEAVGAFPTHTCGRDELGTGDMWNSNSLVSWLLVSAGVDLRELRPPDDGRAPGWQAGIAAAS